MTQTKMQILLDIASSLEKTRDKIRNNTNILKESTDLQEIHGDTVTYDKLFTTILETIHWYIDKEIDK